MKGISLALTVIILISLALMVLFFTINYFKRQTGDVDKVELQANLMKCCQKWISLDGCKESDINPSIPSSCVTNARFSGCDDFCNWAIKYGLTNNDGGLDKEKLKDFCGCPGYE